MNEPPSLILHKSHQEHLTKLTFDGDDDELIIVQA
jgi:hypothetical protein